MIAYTKEFLVNAFMSKYDSILVGEERDKFKDRFGDKFYDLVGKDNFRVYCALDAAFIKTYKERLK